MNSCTGTKTISEWSGITINIKADNSVETSQKITGEKGGFQKLDITLSNRGTEVVTIDSIEICIPIPLSIAQDMKVALRSSCMGQRPVLIYEVGEPQKNSYSYMYAMLQMTADQYIFVGSLNWRIFIPTFTQEDNAFVIHSNGEGKQLKPGETIHYEQIVLSRSSDWQEVLDSFGLGIILS
jgi:alpha-galactosidase